MPQKVSWQQCATIFRSKDCRAKQTGSVAIDCLTFQSLGTSCRPFAALSFPLSCPAFGPPLQQTSQPERTHAVSSCDSMQQPNCLCSIQTTSFASGLARSDLFCLQLSAILLEHLLQHRQPADVIGHNIRRTVECHGSQELHGAHRRCSQIAHQRHRLYEISNCTRVDLFAFIFTCSRGSVKRAAPRKPLHQSAPVTTFRQTVVACRIEFCRPPFKV